MAPKTLGIPFQAIDVFSSETEHPLFGMLYNHLNETWLDVFYNEEDMLTGNELLAKVKADYTLYEDESAITNWVLDNTPTVELVAYDIGEERPAFYIKHSSAKNEEEFVEFIKATAPTEVVEMLTAHVTSFEIVNDAEFYGICSVEKNDGYAFIED